MLLIGVHVKKAWCHKTMPCHAHVHAHVKKELVPQEWCQVCNGHVHVDSAMDVKSAWMRRCAWMHMDGFVRGYRSFE